MKITSMKSWHSVVGQDPMGDIIKMKEIVRNSTGFQREIEDLRIAKFAEEWRDANQYKYPKVGK